MMQKPDIRKHHDMMVIAEMYNQDPNHKFLKRFSPGAMKGIKNLAKAIRKAKKRGEIK